jgi:hypothetical protein
VSQRLDLDGTICVPVTIGYRLNSFSLFHTVLRHKLELMKRQVTNLWQNLGDVFAIFDRISNA